MEIHPIFPPPFVYQVHLFASLRGDDRRWEWAYAYDLEEIREKPRLVAREVVEFQITEQIDTVRDAAMGKTMDALDDCGQGLIAGGKIFVEYACIVYDKRDGVFGFAMGPVAMAVEHEASLRNGLLHSFVVEVRRAYVAPVTGQPA